MTQAQALIVHVEVQECGEHFYASSRDVPGLNVCGDTRDQACDSAVRAIKRLFKLNRGVDIDVKPLAESFEEFDQPVAQCDKFVALAA